MTCDEVAAGHATLLVPLGATEQHGPHLPLGTDTVVATAWADRVAELLDQAGDRVVVAPALPFGSSGEHQMFAGTLSIGGDALRSVIVELTRSAADTFDRVVFLSGHAGNLRPLTEAVAQLRHEGHRVVHLFPSWPANPRRPIDAHAGRTETSLLLHLRPAAVRLDRMAPGDTRPLGEILDRLLAEGVGAVSPTGVLGDPTAANAAEGAALFDELVERTVERLRNDRTAADQRPASPQGGRRGQYDSGTGH